MKHLRFFFTIMAAAWVVAACDDNKDDDSPYYQNDPTSLEWIFKGLSKTTQTSGSTYSHPSVISQVLFNPSHTRCDLFLYQVSFATPMPLIDMEIYGLNVQQVEDDYKISGNAIVPISDGREFESFTIYSFEGLATISGFNFTMTCGDGDKYPAYPVDYDSKAYKLQYGDIEEKPGNGAGISEGKFSGKVEVIQTDGTTYQEEKVVFEITFDDETKEKGSIVMYDVAFSEGMAQNMRLDELYINGVEFQNTGTRYELSGENIIPVWNTTPVKNYTVTGLDGVMTSNSLTVSMTCGTYPLHFTGNLIED